MTEDAAARLGRLIRERRKTLKLTQSDVQAAGGPSTATLRLIEGGKHTDFRPSTSQPLESALRWQTGSIASVLDGGEPTPIASASADFSGASSLSPGDVVVRPRPTHLQVQGHPPSVAVAPSSTVWSSVPVPKLIDAVAKVASLLEGMDDMGDAVPYELHVDRIELRTVLTGVLTSLLAGTDRHLEPAIVAQIDALIRRMYRGREEDALPPLHLAAARDPDDDLTTHDEAAKEHLIEEALLGHYVEMFLRALNESTTNELVQQARGFLGDDDDPTQVVAPEISNTLYVRYVAARHSAIQGGSPDVHAGTELSPDERQAASSRYQRERSEMILFNGRVRTAGVAADPVAEAIRRVAPTGYVFGQSDHGEAGGEEPQIDVNQGDDT